MTQAYAMPMRLSDVQAFPSCSPKPAGRPAVSARTAGGLMFIAWVSSMGSGSLDGLSEEGLQQLLAQQQVIESRAAAAEAAHADAVETRPISEQLLSIRSTLGLSATDVASLLDVSRPTFYAWLEGQEPKGDASGRILHLVKQADKIGQLELRRADNLIKRPIFANGLSLFDILKRGEHVDPYLSTLREIDSKEAGVRSRSADASKEVKNRPQPSTPLHSE